MEIFLLSVIIAVVLVGGYYYLDHQRAKRRLAARRKQEKDALADIWYKHGRYDKAHGRPEYIDMQEPHRTHYRRGYYE